MLFSISACKLCLKCILLLSFLYILHTNCNTGNQPVPDTYTYIQPQYGLVGLNTIADTISFALDEHTYKDIKSFNVFREKNTEYIAFYDRRSESINVYDYSSRQLANRFTLKKFIPGQLYKTSVFLKNFNNIFIANKTSLYLFDSTGTKKKSIHFLDEPAYAWPVFENCNPPVINDTSLFAIVRPNVKYKSLGALKEWKVLYEFNLQTGKAILHYSLPGLYRKGLYGYYFLDYNFCYNNNGYFVFSFPADTVIYETNLTNYHKSYFARSKNQQSDIKPVNKEALEKDEGLKAYSTRDSYGTVFFDPYRKYYLRLAKQRVSEEEFVTKSRKRKQTVLIFDEHFKIIGESEISNEIIFDSLFFTSDGNIYARINAKDEYALHFVQLQYEEKNSKSERLTRK